jgi:phytoene dehydrogenase-like protein
MGLSRDAVVIGGGHHGLVAATVLADAGWEVCLLEAAEEVGGAVRSVLRPAGYVTDLYSAFYPLSAVSPVLRSLRLAEHGLRWSHASVVLAHPPRPQADTAAVLHRDPQDTAAGLAAEHPADGTAWLESRSMRRPAASTAGCWRCWARTSASRCRSAGPVSWRRRWPGGRRRPAHSCTPGSGWSASRWPAAAPWGCAPRAG